MNLLNTIMNSLSDLWYGTPDFGYSQECEALERYRQNGEVDPLTDEELRLQEPERFRRSV